MKESRIEELIIILRSSEDEFARYKAAESLGKIDPGNPTAIQALTGLLRTSENEHIRCQAAESLWKIARDKAIKPWIFTS